METGYQRGKIQEESMATSTASTTAPTPSSGSTPSVIPQSRRGRSVSQKVDLIRSTEDEKQSQLKRLGEFHRHHEKESRPMLERLQQAVIRDDNVFAVLMEAVRVASLGQITHALFEVGGQYRRNM